MVDGHARVALAIKAGEKVPVVYVELDEREEAVILATLDPLSAMAERDEKLLAELLGDVVVGDDALARLVAKLAGPAAGTVRPCLPGPSELLSWLVSFGWDGASDDGRKGALSSKRVGEPNRTW